MSGSAAHGPCFPEREIYGEAERACGALGEASPLPTRPTAPSCPGTFQCSRARPGRGKACGCACGLGWGHCGRGLLWGPGSARVHHAQPRLKAKGLGASDQAAAGQGGARYVPVCGGRVGAAQPPEALLAQHPPCLGDHLPGVTCWASRPQGAGDKGILLAEIMVLGVDPALNLDPATARR